MWETRTVFPSCMSPGMGTADWPVTPMTGQRPRRGFGWWPLTCPVWAARIRGPATACLPGPGTASSWPRTWALAVSPPSGGLGAPVAVHAVGRHLAPARRPACRLARAPIARPHRSAAAGPGTEQGRGGGGEEPPDVVRGGRCCACRRGRRLSRVAAGDAALGHPRRRGHRNVAHHDGRGTATAMEPVAATG
jgi:hypothetical protein